MLTCILFVWCILKVFPFHCYNFIVRLYYFNYTGRYMGYFWILAITNSAMVNMAGHVSRCICAESFPEFIPRSTTGRPSVHIFKFTRFCWTVSHSGFANLHSHHQNSFCSVSSPVLQTVRVKNVSSVVVGWQCYGAGDKRVNDKHHQNLCPH